MQVDLFEYFSSHGHNGFLKDSTKVLFSRLVMGNEDLVCLSSAVIIKQLNTLKNLRDKEVNSLLGYCLLGGRVLHHYQKLTMHQENNFAG